MRVSRVRLRNVCQHRELEFTLAPGLNAIMGPNGSGKSNALKAIYAALTNDWSRNHGQKDLNICQMAGDREPSEVELEFEHQRATYRLTRKLRPSKQELVVPGEAPITRDALVNQRVGQVLSVTPELLDKYVFVDQWAIFDFLTATDTERAKAFARLFGTTDAEACWKALGEHLSGIEVPQVLADLDGQRHGLKQTQAVIDDLERQLAQFAALPEQPDANDADRQAVRDAHVRRKLEDEIAQTERRLQGVRSDLAAARQERAEFAADRDNLRAALDGGQGAVDAAKAALANWQTLKSVQQSRARVELQLERALAESGLRPKPNRCGLYVSDLDAEYNDRHDFLEAEIRRAETFIRSFDPATGQAECPTCFTPRENLADAVRAAKEALPALKTEYAERRNRIEYSRRIDREEREYNEWHTRWVPQVDQLRKQLADLKTIPRPDHDEDALRRIVGEATEVSQALRDVERELAKVDEEVNLLQGRATGDEQRLVAARAELGAIALVNPESLAQIEARIGAQTTAFGHRARLRGELRGERRHLQAFADSITLLEGRRAEAERVHALVRHLNEMRRVLHRDNLPRIVAEHYLRELQLDTNDFLGVFDAPFRVETDEKLSFRAIFNDGREQPAGRLSGGEKVVLALAFRLSVNSMFAQDVGLLCLDEPTVGLDEHNLGCLSTALERLKELTRSRGLQVILVTHERSLGHLFDRVIDLSLTA